MIFCVFLSKGNRDGRQLSFTYHMSFWMMFDFNVCSDACSRNDCPAPRMTLPFTREKSRGLQFRMWCLVCSVDVVVSGCTGAGMSE